MKSRAPGAAGDGPAMENLIRRYTRLSRPVRGYWQAPMQRI
ncbi:MAG: hypothetical protein ACLUDF_07575 [Butyricicoccus sp.]